MVFRPFELIAVVFVLLLTSGCAATAPTRGVPEPRAERPTAAPAPAPKQSSVANVDALREEQLRAMVAEWEGTPHRYGGTSRDGLDCSAFTQIVSADLFGVRLPRSTAEQVRVGRPVQPDALRAGDLVFFQPSRKTRHVGIYLSDGAFAHVSSSRGVMISRLEQSYWRNAYWTARRILPDAVPYEAPLVEETPPGYTPPRMYAAPDSSPPPAPRPARRRPGW